MLVGLPAHLITRLWDPRRRVPQACAIFIWGKLMFWTNPFWSIRVTGMEHLQSGGPFLVCCNHQSLIDSLAMLMIGHQVKFISHEKVFKAPLLGPYMKWCGYVAVNPKNPFPAPRVARDIKHWWDLNESVCLYPEGTRSADGQLQPFKVGGFRLARNAKVTVVPVAIDGTHPILPKGRFTFEKSAFFRINIRILPPITAEDYGNDAIQLCRMTHDSIEDALAEMRGRTPVEADADLSPAEAEPTSQRVANA